MGKPRPASSWRDRVGPWGPVLLQTYVLYMAGYLARKPLSLTKTLLSEPAPVGVSLHVNRAGTLDSLYMLAHAVGKFYAGRAIVRFGSLAVLWASCLSTAATVAAFASLSSYGAMKVVWTLSGLSTGFTFLAALSVLDGILSDPAVGHTILGFWCTSINVGGIAGNLASAHILAHGWRAVFRWAAALLVPLSALAACIHVPKPDPGHSPSPGTNHLDVDIPEANRHTAGKSAKDAPGTLELLSDASVACCAGANLCVKLSKYSFVLWLPAFYVHRLGASAAAASIASTTDDLGGLTGLCFLGVLLARQRYASSPLALARDSLCIALASLLGLAAALRLLGDDNLHTTAGLASAVMLAVGATGGEIPETLCTVVAIPAVARNLALSRLRRRAARDGAGAEDEELALGRTGGADDEEADAARAAKELEPHILSVISSIGSLGPLLCGPIMAACVNLLGWDALVYGNVAFVALGGGLSALGATLIERRARGHKAGRRDLHST